MINFRSGNVKTISQPILDPILAAIEIQLRAMEVTPKTVPWATTGSSPIRS